MNLSEKEILTLRALRDVLEYPALLDVGLISATALARRLRGLRNWLTGENDERRLVGQLVNLKRKRLVGYEKVGIWRITAEGERILKETEGDPE